MMVPLLVALFMVVPVAVAWARSTGHSHADPETIRAARWRLTWTALLLASITVAHAVFERWIGARSTMLAPAPTIFMAWVPLASLVRYFMLLDGPPDRVGGGRRAASLSPRQAPRTIRLTWFGLAIGWFLCALAIGRMLWATPNLVAVCLLLIAAMWLGLGYLLAARQRDGEAETFRGDSEASNRVLATAYAQRRLLTDWTSVVLFSFSATLHIALAAAMASQPGGLRARWLPYAVVVFAIIGMVHGLLRRRLDANIAAQLDAHPAG
ncbi:MAG: hypothetical protein GKS06_09855 [Acidobacteria bacterium]|nr:hypothetical protein [Acidobacteriota bacterium]